MPFEILAVVAILFVATTGLIRLLTKRRHRIVAGLVLIAVAATFAGTAFQYWLPSVQPQSVSHRPVEVRGDGYVSSRTCRACHPRNYATWFATWHRTMTQVATADTALATFDGNEHRVGGKRYRMYRRGKSLWAELPTRNAASGTMAGTPVPIVMSTGSHHMQVFWYPTGRGRTLGQFPLVYVKEASRWLPRQATFLMPPSTSATEETGRWNFTCVKCHTTHGRPRTVALVGAPDGEHVDSDAAEFGIACEACHGPGERHLSANRSLLRRYALHLGDASDDTIVNPARLPPRLAAQVCGQCHSVSAARNRQVGRRIQNQGPLYRPGSELTATRRVVRPRDDARDPWLASRVERNPEFLRARFWSDGVVRVAGREYNGLIESPCYQHGDESKGVLSCLSCHRLHKDDDDPRALRTWANDLLDVGMRGNAACVQCHDRFDTGKAIEAHTRHSSDSSGSLCYNCHMPYTTYGLLTAMRSHTIRSPSVRETLRAGRLNACNGCHLDKSLKWTAHKLEAWYGLAQPPLETVHERTPASVHALLSGDAGQRALVAWAMGWEPAMQISGEGWRERFLAVLLTDPYDAVRFIANRALRKQPDFQAFEYDFLGPQEERTEAATRVLEQWRDATGGESADREALFAHLLAQRDDRPLTLAE